MNSFNLTKSARHNQKILALLGFNVETKNIPHAVKNIKEFTNQKLFIQLGEFNSFTFFDHEKNNEYFSIIKNFYLDEKFTKINFEFLKANRESINNILVELLCVKSFNKDKIFKVLLSYAYNDLRDNDHFLFIKKLLKNLINTEFPQFNDYHSGLGLIINSFDANVDKINSFGFIHWHKGFRLTQNTIINHSKALEYIKAEQDSKKEMLLSFEIYIKKIENEINHFFHDELIDFKKLKRSKFTPDELETVFKRFKEIYFLAFKNSFLKVLDV